MSGDFGSWDNRASDRSLHRTPPNVERIFRAEQRRLERRNNLLALTVFLIIVGAALLIVLKIG